MRKVPVVLVGVSYWRPLMYWLRDTMYEKEGNISEEDFDLFTIVDTPEEAMVYILDNIPQDDINF
jgi:predicted Rossmann-fold nucleotide-binding protein